jgi:hypothetical protein
MDREGLIALRSAIDMVLTWPDSVRVEMTRWLASAPAKPNGRDAAAVAAVTPPLVAETLTAQPRPGKPHRGKPHRGKHAAADERTLLEAVRDNPGAGERALAAMVGRSRSVVGERLRRLAAHGAIEKDANGHWRVKETIPAMAPAPVPTPAPAPAPDASKAKPSKEAWIKPISDYGRSETNAGLPYRPPRPRRGGGELNL